MFKKVLSVVLAIFASVLVPAPAQAVAPTVTTAPSYMISGAVAVENMLFANLGTWTNTTSYKIEFYACTSAHTDSVSLPGDCTLLQTSTDYNNRYDIEAADLGKYLMAVITGINADSETAHYMDTTGPVLAQATHSCSSSYEFSGTGDANSDCTKTVEDASGTSGPLYHLFTGNYSVVLEGGDGGDSTYYANTVQGGEGARIAFDITTPVYTWTSSYWSMFYTPGGDGYDSQAWIDSWCSDDRNYTQGAGLYYSGNEGQTGGFGGARAYMTLTVSSTVVAYAHAAGGGGAGCNGGAGGNAGGVSTTAVDRSTNDTIYVAYGEDGQNDSNEGGISAYGGTAKTLAGGGAGGVGTAPGNTTTLQACLDGMQTYGGGGGGSVFDYGNCGIFAADKYSGSAIAQYSYANARIWEGGAGGSGYYGTIDGSNVNLAGYAGGHVDYTEDQDFGGGGGSGGGSVYKLGTDTDTYFSSLVLEQNTRTTTQGSVTFSHPAQPVPDEPTITSITAGSSGTAVVNVTAAETGVVGAQFVVYQEDGKNGCSGFFDADTGLGSCTVSGLTAGNSYDFAPRTMNPFGYSSRGPVESFTAVGEPPVNTVSPTISGTARVNMTLTATAGTWTGATGSATYKWYACDASVSSASSSLASAAPYNCTEISGATSSTYALTASEQGKYVLVGETRVASDGASATKFSASTGAVAAALPAPGISSVTSGSDNSVGATISLTVNTSNSPTLTFQWYQCDTSFSYVYTSVQAGCTAISGATNSSYTVTSGDVGKYIYYYIVGTNGTAPDVTVFSGIATVVALPPAPNSPTGVSASAGNSSATVSWNSSTGATSYTVTSNPGGLTCETSGTSCNVVGLTNGVSYTFTVVAENAGGSSVASNASSSVTPSAGGSAPAAPTGVTASAGNASATVSWSAVSGATSYTVTSNPGGLTCETSGTSCNVVGLTNGVSYTFTVIAENSYGDSSASNASSSVTPSAGGSAPAAPTGVTASAGNASATVSWSAVSGATTYTVTANPGGIMVGTSSTSIVFDMLTNGVSYTFTVEANNGYGSSAPSSPSNAVTPTAGGGSTPPTNAPAAPKATAGDGTATITWLEVFGAVAYKVTTIPAGPECNTVTTSCVMTGLTNGQNYFFTVVAIFANGSVSQASALVGPIKPIGDPNNPSEDPDLNFVAPKQPIKPGAVKTTTGGKNTVTTTSTGSGSHELKVNFGKPGNGLVKLTSLLEDTDSVIALRKISGLKALVFETNSTIRISGDGYSAGTYLQVYLQSASSDNVVYLGRALVQKGGSFKFEYQLDGSLAAGNYVLQINGLILKNLEYKLRSTNIGSVVVDSAIQRVYFQADSSKLTREAKNEIAQNLETLKAGALLTMYAYTTGEVTAGFEKTNKELAKQRAKVLRDYLVKLGINENLIKIKVIGAVIPKNLSEPWRNRRVDVYIKF